MGCPRHVLGPICFISITDLLQPLILKSDLWSQDRILASGALTSPSGGEGLLLAKKAGRILVKESGSSGTVLTFCLPNVSGSRSSPLSSLVGCWKSETLVPWKEVVAVVTVGLWSIYVIHGRCSKQA